MQHRLELRWAIVGAVALLLGGCASGAHPSPSGGFKIFTMPEPFPKVAHAETPQGGIYIESPDCDRIVQTYDRLRGLTLDPQASADLISAVMEELS